jgi:predicted RNA binding protein YcfA (HicA-like mRNA interferase family)
MSNLPQVSGRELTKAFLKEGWYLASQRGSHVKLRLDLKPVGKATVIIPQHKVIKKGTLGRILKDGGMTLEKLKKLI